MSRPLTDMFFVAVSETLVLVLCAGLAALLLGVPLGLILHASARRRAAGRQRALPARLLVLGVRALRATPAIIILAATIPLAHVMLNHAGALAATLAPLILLAASFMAGRTERALDDAHGRFAGGQPFHGRPAGSRDAGASDNTTGAQTRAFPHTKAPETASERALWHAAAPAIAAGLGLMLAVLVGYAALAGALSGVGLGGFGLRHGYQEFRPLVLLGVAATLLVLAETGQVLGQALAQRLGGAGQHSRRASFMSFRRNR